MEEKPVEPGINAPDFWVGNPSMVVTSKDLGRDWVLLTQEDKPLAPFIAARGLCF